MLKEVQAGRGDQYQSRCSKRWLRTFSQACTLVTLRMEYVCAEEPSYRTCEITLQG